MARIAPRPVAEWPPEMHDALQAFRPPGSAPLPPPPPGGRPVSNAVGTFARYPELAKGYLSFNGHVLWTSSLSPRHRELTVLRVAFLRRCEYEWAQHVLLGAEAGLSSEEIGRIVDGPERPEWESLEGAILRAVDELILAAEITDATWKELASRFDDRQLMDLVFTVGAYETLAMALRSFAVDPEPNIVPYLPAETGAWSRAGVHSDEGS